MIRIATLDDVPVLVTMGRHQVAALYGGVLPENVDQLTALTSHLITSPYGVVFLAEQAGQPVGMIGMTLYSHHITGIRTAGEVAWWVEPEARGIGLVLMKRAEQWAYEHGAEHLQMMAPNARVGKLYERRGYLPLETTYQRTVSPAMSGVTVHDDVLTEQAGYLSEKLSLPFADVVSNGVTFHGIAGIGGASDPLAQWITGRYPTLLPTLTFVRQSPEGQDEPNFIHTDTDMGEWTGILFLTPDPPAGDGTTFWRNRQTGAIQSLSQTEDEYRAEWLAWRDRSQWAPWQTVAAKPNRLVLFPAPYFHSRAIEANYGQADASRLIQVVFGTGTLQPEGR